jgi:DNA repair protein RecO (recombination protein O)
VPLYRDEAVVLRVHKLGEADRIVSLLTRRHGRVRAVGRGVRRTTSKFGARLEPGSHVDVQLLTRNPQGAGDAPARRKLDTVIQTESLDAFGAQLAGDYARWTSLSAICETAERLTEEGEPALRLYLRAMSGAGWEPALRECASCSAPGPHVAFNVAAGGSVCETCRPPGSPRPQAGTIDLMVALLGGDWPRADVSPGSVRREASGLIAAHLQWHLERGLRSLPLVDR